MRVGQREQAAREAVDERLVDARERERQRERDRARAAGREVGQVDRERLWPSRSGATVARK
jgi:hypothetical protein